MRTARGLFGAGAAAIALLALVERLGRLPALPFADADAWGYMRPAVLLFTEGRYVHTASREFVYPLFLHGVLRTFDEWSAVPVVQHVLGVAGGLVLLAAWMRIPLPEAAPRALHLARSALGLGLLAAHLLLAQTMVFEHLLRPEAVSQAVGSMAFFALAGLFAGRSEDARRAQRRLLREGGLLIGSVALLGMLRPQTLLALPAAALLVAVLGRARCGPRAAALAVALPLTLAAVGLWIPDRILADDDPVAGRFSAGVLFFWHFHLVDDVLEADLAAGRLGPAEAALARDLLAAFEDEKARHRREGRKYLEQGYNPDRLYYGPAGRRLWTYCAEAPDACRRFALEGFLRAVVRDPLGYAAKVLHHLATPYRWPEGVVLNHRSYFTNRFLLERSHANLRRAAPEMAPHPPSRRYLEALARVPEAPPDREGKLRVWLFGHRGLGLAAGKVYALLAWLYVPLLAGALALGLATRPRWDDRPLLATTLAASGLLFAAHLTSAAVHGLEEPRYVLALSGFSLYAEFAAGLFVVVRGAGLAGARRGP